MTEYDYSPEAIERHLATQQRIARWVDQTREQSPSNPFIPLPGEHTTTTQIQHPHPHRPHPHPFPQPAFYATPQGNISPAYSSSRKHGHSQRPSPSPLSTPVIMPPGYRPVLGDRSFSTPPSPVRKFYSVPSTPYISYPTGSPLNPSPYGSQYQPSPISHPSYSQSSFHSIPSSHMQANPTIQQQHPGGNTYFQPYPPPQPVVVIRGDGGYVVLPSPGQQVQVISPQPIYETQDHRGVNFFGRLKGLSTKSSKSKKSKRSRRDSY